MSVPVIYDGDRKGTVLRIERSSVHDGPGLRTVLFLKGCPLRCQWCSTPESQSFEIEKTEENTYGTIMSVEQVMRELRKDSLFFFISTGGITVSGGEIMAQPDFTRSVLKNCRMECMHTAIETTFFAQWETIHSILPYVNLAFVDMKFFTKELHEKYCGVDNTLIQENLLKTNDIEEKFQLVIRTPIIPGINDSEEELCKIGAFCSKLKKLSYMQLLPYHKLGTATYAKLGREYLLGDIQSPTVDEMAKHVKIMERYVENVIF
ncbi:MAG: glycyl-radical enzyme activating protein [Eubacteriales bacterium]|nr:glycyl-radical enzyme activating protein [Eubacteriales bacterium]